MAQVLGQAGRYVTQEAARKRRKIWLTAVLSVAACFWISGFLCGSLFGRLRVPPWLALATAVVAAGFAKLVMDRAERHMAALEREQTCLERGAAGETSVAKELGKFPEEFRVINDLATPFGNLDHVVVGPTGVFLLDAKAWRGVVTSDGNGELLCNGRPTDKPYVRQFVGRVMGVKDKIRLLASGIDPFFQPVFVFTSARVDANWGTTRSVHCIREDQLHGYIVESKFGKKLSPQQVATVAQAFLALAHMEKDFTDRSIGAPRPKSAPVG
jgi:hypothetical protein